eukprot:gene16042-33714_t
MPIQGSSVTPAKRKAMDSTDGEGEPTKEILEWLVKTKLTKETQPAKKKTEGNTEGVELEATTAEPRDILTGEVSRDPSQNAKIDQPVQMPKTDKKRKA